MKKTGVPARIDKGLEEFRDTLAKKFAIAKTEADRMILKKLKMGDKKIIIEREDIVF